MVDLLFVNANRTFPKPTPKARRLVRSHISRLQHEHRRNDPQQASGCPQLHMHVHDKGHSTCIAQNGSSRSRNVRTKEGSPNTHRTCISKHDLPVTTPAVQHESYRGSPSTSLRSTSRPARTNSSPALQIARLPNPDSGESPKPSEQDDFPEAARSPSRTSNNDLLALCMNQSSETLGCSRQNAEVRIDTASVLTHNHATMSIPVSLEDPTDELQMVTRRFGIGLQALNEHYGIVFDVMATICEPAYGMPQGSMRTIVDSCMRDDPAARATVLLTAALSLRYNKQQPIGQVGLFSLYNFTIKVLQEALDDPRRCFSDAVLLAVGSIGISELYYGRTSSYDIHTRALKYLRKARGECRDANFNRIMHWMDDLRAKHIARWTCIAYSN